MNFDKSASSARENKKRNKNKYFIKRMLLVFFLLFFAGIGMAGGWLYIIVKDLPSIASLKDYRPSIITRVYADNHELIDEFYLEDRKVIQVPELPKFVIQAFVAAEDARFFQHKGVDFQSIVRAFFKNLEAGTIVQGGSTITQQVAKSLFLSPEKKYIRKMKEAILAYKIDRYLDKYAILNLYLNQIYLGHGTYGLEAASQRYFGKRANNLSLPEAALLAGLPKAPTRYSPVLHPQRARTRQIYVLNRMAEDGYITELEKQKAIESLVEIIQSREKNKIAPHFTENVRRYIQAKYGSEVLYKEGIEVYTTLNIEMQKAAKEAVERGLKELDKREGYRGAVDKIPESEFEAFLAENDENCGDNPLQTGEIVKALVLEVKDQEKIVELRVGKYKGIMSLETMEWARKPDSNVAYNTVKIKNPSEIVTRGDVVEARILSINETKHGAYLDLALEQEPKVEGALICIDAKTGEIKAMVGGRNYKKSEFNRATQAKRLPGSAFKPFIYTAAFDKGMTPATVIMDSPIIYEDTFRDSIWKPQNFSEKFYGPTTLRTALIKSRNLVTIKLLKDIDIDYAADYIANMGITSPLTRDLSMALGTSSVTLEEMVKGYSVFANSGKKVEPFFISQIVDRNGTVFEQADPKIEQVCDSRIAYITSHILQEVVQRGTGWRIKSLGKPVAGKTGTTNDLRDAWFIGFTPSYVAGVWVGSDDFKPLGKYETGSRAASPIFLYFMEKALKSKPVESFTPPRGVVFARIDPSTGLLARSGSEYVFECFLEGTAPTEYAPEDADNKRPDFLKYDLGMPGKDEIDRLLD